MNKDEAIKVAHRMAVAVKTLELQNDYYNTLPRTKDLKHLSQEELSVKYLFLNEALVNIFELNQSLIEDLDDAVSFIYDLAEDIQDSQTEE